MHIKTIATLAIASATLLAGCETTSTRPYETSTDNVIAYQSAFKASGAKVKLGTFTTSENVDTSPTCRMMGALEVLPGKTPVDFIASAFKDELFEAGVYDGASDMVINGNINELKFNSFGTGKWTINMNVSSSAMPDGYDVSTEYSFKTSYSAIRACQNVVDAFTPAVQDLLGKVVASPDFAKLTE
jgi:hypothetical protein